MRILTSAAVALALVGCASSGLNTPHAQLEKREADAELAYQAAMDGFNTAHATGKLSDAAYKSDVDQAANDLNALRTAYNAGQDITSQIVALNNDKATAQSAAKGN